MAEQTVYDLVSALANAGTGQATGSLGAVATAPGAGRLLPQASAPPLRWFYDAQRGQVYEAPLDVLPSPHYQIVPTLDEAYPVLMRGGYPLVVEPPDLSRFRTSPEMRQRYQFQQYEAPDAMLRGLWEEANQRRSGLGLPTSGMGRLR